MVIEIPKGTPEEKVKAILNIKENKQHNSVVNEFFGKLPHIKDGLKIQKKIRSEWK